MVLSNVDRELLQRCLDRQADAWHDFVDRFAGLVTHVIRHTSEIRSVSLTQEAREDLVADVFASLLRDDMAVLRKFRGQSSLATYLTVVARRVVVRGMMQWKQKTITTRPLDSASQAASVQKFTSEEASIESAEAIEQAMHQLSGNEAKAIRMFHLEGKTYQEIGSHIGMPENSVGPLLSQARDKMRRSIP